MLNIFKKFQNFKNKKYKEKLYSKVIIQEMNSFEKELIQICKKYSMTNEIRMWNLIKSFEYVMLNKVEGDFVETGVWKGGNLILLQKLLDKFYFSSDKNKFIWGYDTFTGMSKPSKYDKDLYDKPAYEIWQKSNKENYNEWCYCSKNEVLGNFKKENTNIKYLKLIKGKVEDTLKEDDKVPEKISILRLDTDWYESSKIELEVLFPKLSKGGILILDDYGHWKGVYKAVNEYFYEKNIVFNYVDYGCRFAIKVK